MIAASALTRLSRTLHTCLGGLALGLLLFVSITGFMLNHSTWFGLADGRTRAHTLSLPPPMLRQPDKFSIVEELRRHLGNVGLLDAFEVEENQLRIIFKCPGSRTDAVIDRATGQTDLTTETRGAVGLLTDLHKSASAGKAWPYVLDAAAILLAVASLTGMVLIFSLAPRRRRTALILSVAGLAVGAAVYVLCVA